MGKMKEVFTLKQKLVALDPSYANMPDSYFFDLYLQKKLSKDVEPEPHLIECPNCKKDAHNTTGLKRDQKEIMCTHCGYTYSLRIKRRVDRSTLKPDDYELFAIEHPYGVLSIKLSNNETLSTIPLKDENEYHLRVADARQDKTLVTCILSRFIDGVFQHDVIIDNRPNVDHDDSPQLPQDTWDGGQVDEP